MPLVTRSQQGEMNNNESSNLEADTFMIVVFVLWIGEQEQ